MVPVEMWKTSPRKSFPQFGRSFPQRFPQGLWKTNLLPVTVKWVFHISTGPTTTTRYINKIVKVLEVVKASLVEDYFEAIIFKLQNWFQRRVVEWSSASARRLCKKS
jgi:hypothetical protein